MSEHSRDTESTPEIPYGTSEIPSSYYRYKREARRLQAEHTGSPDLFLDEAKEQEFAQIIAAATFARNGLVELKKTDEERAAIEEERYQPLLAASVEAQHTLIETNLRFAAYYARASMNIFTPTNDRSTDLPNHGRPGAYGDITKLRSRYADLDDRTQIANEALIEAAKTFTPKKDKKGDPVSFTSYVKYHIHNALSKHAKTNETPGWYVNANQMDMLYAARKNAAATTTPEHERLSEMNKGRYTIPFEEVPTPLEELNEGIHHPFEVADVVADINGETSHLESLYELRDTQITAALKTLSEREAGIIRLRFGLNDGEPKTLDQVGVVYGVTRERIRQIESKAISRLRHPSRSVTLKEFLDLESDAKDETGPLTLEPVALGIANLRTSRSIAQEHGDSDEPPILDIDSSLVKKESWQTSADEPWDLQPKEERAFQAFEQTAQQFELLLYTAPVYVFQRSFAEEMKSPYPVALVETINEQLGTSLTGSHIEDFWNNHISDYVQSLQEQLGDDFSLDRVSALFSRLLTEHIGEDDRIELHIPTEMDGKLNGLGTGLQAGELVIQGNVGDFTGNKMAGVASITVNGSVGDFAAANATGFASLEVTGDARHFTGTRLTESSNVYIHGSVGDFCGQGMYGIDAFIEVDGDAGANVGEGALLGMIEIRGTGYSAHPDNEALISGDFAEWLDDTSEEGRAEISAKLGELAINNPNATDMVEQILKYRVQSPDVIIAKIDAIAESINEALSGQAVKMPMRADQPPERLLFGQACAWFGVSAEELNDRLEETGHARNADLTSSDITTLAELYPELQIEMAPQNGYTSIEMLIQKLSIRESPQRLLRFFIKHNIPLYEFRDVDGRVKYFISDENY